jgi:hypothetical protein
VVDVLHHLELAFRGARVEVRLNGFLLAAEEAQVGARQAPPVNHLLVGRENVLEVGFLPTNNDEPQTLAGVGLQAALKSYEPGGVVAPETGKVLRRFDLPACLLERAAEVELPATVSWVFGNEGANFGARLREAPVVDDTEAVLAFGLRLRSLLQEGDHAALGELFQPKLEDYALAYGQSPEALQGQFREFARARLSAEGLDFSGDLSLRRECGGRLWELNTESNRPLIRATDGGFELPVRVGLVEGALKVVR